MQAHLIDTLSVQRDKKALFWWQPETGGSNVGDELSRIVVTSILASGGKRLFNKRDPEHRLFAVGSVLRYANNGDCVWGSGAQRREDIVNAKHLDVRAVRGPITRDILANNGIDAPAVYGDPGLLMPLFFPTETMLMVNSRLQSPSIVVVPSFHETREKYDAWKENVIVPTCDPLVFVAHILNASLVISSSLHGIVLAEAYGIPAIYLDWDSGEDPLRYEDYYLGTGRTQWNCAHTVEEAMFMGGGDPFDLGSIQRQLLQSFPYDLW